MLNSDNNNLPLKSTEVDYDAITKKKIDKHLSDINDEITEDDIKNVRTDIHSGDSDPNIEPRNMVRSETDRKDMPSVWEIEE